jgi:hypothetical protein
MPRKLAVVGMLLVSVTATAQVPSQAPSSAAPPAASAAAATAKADAGLPTYWVLMVTGEKDGAPWLKTSTPETLGGIVKGTGPWTCRYPATERGAQDGVAYEQLEVACGVGEAEVFVSLRCSYRNKIRPGKVAGKQWKRSELQTLNLRHKGDAKSTVTVSLRCDVDAAFATD